MYGLWQRHKWIVRLTSLNITNNTYVFRCDQFSLQYSLHFQQFIHTVQDPLYSHLIFLNILTGLSPDRLPPAGIRRATSIGDTRLLKPSDDSQYLRSPEREQK